jgi:hypothetical protein
MNVHAETLTEFLRKPNEVLKEVDKHDVVLRRTGGKPAVRLSLESRASAVSAGIELATHLLADAFAAVPEVPIKLAQLLERRFPWTRFLPTDDRLAFAREFVETLQACASVGSSARLEEMVRDWKATAAIHADPVLAAELKRTLPGTSRRVPPPKNRGQKR